MRYFFLLMITIPLMLSASDTVRLGDLEWQDDATVASTHLNWHDAIDHCEELSLGGHDDWRLPTIKELQSIVDVSRYKPAPYA